MGVALGYCIGSKLANPRKLFVDVDGDGSFNITFTKLTMVAEKRIPVKIILQQLTSFLCLVALTASICALVVFVSILQQRLTEVWKRFLLHLHFL